MRIAQIAPLYESAPPSLYGGAERVVATLADALTDLGCDVTLFASADSRTRATLHPCRDRALRLDPARSWDLPAHVAMLEEVRRRAGAGFARAAPRPVAADARAGRGGDALRLRRLRP